MHVDVGVGEREGGENGAFISACVYTSTRLHACDACARAPACVRRAYVQIRDDSFGSGFLILPEFSAYSRWFFFWGGGDISFVLIYQNKFKFSEISSIFLDYSILNIRNLIRVSVPWRESLAKDPYKVKLVVMIFMMEA